MVDGGHGRSLPDGCGSAGATDADASVIGNPGAARPLNDTKRVGPRTDGLGACGATFRDGRPRGASPVENQ